ncbi:MAG TPA: hypothetical protein VHV82_05900 [Sporichthyaceae bacterium]|nr:hypothetical protein [Sporichthyaceae bacterium]
MAVPTGGPTGAPAPTDAALEPVAADPDVRVSRWLRSTAYLLTTCGSAAATTAVVLVATSGAHPNRPLFLLVLATTLIGLTGAAALAALAGLVGILCGENRRSVTPGR